MNNSVFEITLAALLHDIGKVLQRAAKSDRADLTSASRGLADQVRKGNNSYVHCLWTNDFFAKMSQDSPLARLGVNISDLANAAAYHHNPQTGSPAQLIIQLADQDSAGMDRDTDRIPSDITAYYKRPLESIFSRISNINKDAPASKLHVHIPAPLDPRAVFPLKTDPSITAESGYVGVANGFCEDFMHIATRDKDMFLESVAWLVQKYFWAVPSSTINKECDISLADHLTTTAAIAAAMASQLHGNTTPKDMRFRLVSGDVSGIQQFIFALSGESDRAVAKLLRGRSFLVGMLSRIAARAICAEAGLPSLCCIFEAGGRFAVLGPDSDSFRMAIAAVRQKSEQWLYERFFGDLRVIIDSGVPMAHADFKRDAIGDVFSKSAELIAREKHRFMAGMLGPKPGLWVDEKRYAAFQANRLCPLCGREPAAKPASGADSAAPGRNCRQLAALGNEVTRARFVEFTESSGEDAILGCCELKPLQSMPAPDSTAAVYRINDFILEADEHAVVYPRIFYANWRPMRETGNENEEGYAKTFEHLADAAVGFKGLAALNADVDNMGFIMAKGFGDRDSLSRRVTLSRMLNYFFAGFLPAFLKENYANVYTVFAGGDDLSLIGPWDRMVNLAQAVHKRFAEYIGFNPHITLSAGIELFHAGSPVARASAAAGEALEHAKQNGRDRVMLFGQCMQWGESLNRQLQFVKEWEAYIEHAAAKNGKSRTAMLYRFLSYWRERERALQKGDHLRALRHRFQFIYDISRNVDKKWHVEKPFCELIATKSEQPIEEAALFRHLPAGIMTTLYTLRGEGGDDAEEQECSPGGGRRLPTSGD